MFIPLLLSACLSLCQGDLKNALSDWGVVGELGERKEWQSCCLWLSELPSAPCTLPFMGRSASRDVGSSGWLGHRHRALCCSGKGRWREALLSLHLCLSLALGLTLMPAPW